MKTRKEKINFLKGLLKGERSIREIEPQETTPLFLVLFKGLNDDFFTETDTENKVIIKKWSEYEVKEFEMKQEERKKNGYQFTLVVKFISAASKSRQL